jgi:hypothetical protein
MNKPKSNLDQTSIQAARLLRRSVRRCRYTIRTQPYTAVVAALLGGVLLGWIISPGRTNNEK